MAKAVLKIKLMDRMRGKEIGGMIQIKESVTKKKWAEHFFRNDGQRVINNNFWIIFENLKTTVEQFLHSAKRNGGKVGVLQVDTVKPI